MLKGYFLGFLAGSVTSLFMLPRVVTLSLRVGGALPDAALGHGSEL